MASRSLTEIVGQKKMVNTKRRGKGKEAVNVVEEEINVEEEEIDDDFVDEQWNNSGLRRSGRNKGTADTDVTKDGRKIVKQERVQQPKRKKVESSKAAEIENVPKQKRTKGESSKGDVSQTYQFQTRTSPKKLFNVMQNLSPKQKACLDRMGFRALLEFKLDGIPNRIGFYVADNFNPDSMEIKVGESSIPITRELIGELLGIRNDGYDIMAAEVERDVDMVRNWNDQFEGKKEILTGNVKDMISLSKVADMNFKINFIVLFANVMGGVRGKGVCDLSVLDHLRSDSELFKINWCEYVWRGLQTCKEGWKRDNSNNYFLGPISILTMAYVDGIVCKDYSVGRTRPTTNFWTFEMLKAREKAESDGEGLGMCELAGAYVEEDADPMPDDEEGFVWNLSKVIEAIRRERTCFEKTLDAGLAMFPDSLLISDLNQQYRQALLIKQSGEEGAIPDGVDKSADNGLKSKEGIVETNQDPFDSPAFLMGQETQVQVFRSSDKVCAKFYGNEDAWNFDGPSFSIGLTQDPVFATQENVEGSGSIKEHKEAEVSVEARGSGGGEIGKKMQAKRVNKPVDRSEAMNAVPISVLKPEEGRVKRRITKSDLMVSPYFLRVLGIDNALTAEEKQIDIYLIKKSGGDLSEVMFEAEMVKATMQQMYTLVDGANIDDEVINAWSAFLNSLEIYKDSCSYSRFYFPTFVVDKKKFNTSDTEADACVKQFLMYAEMWAARGGKKLLSDVDIAFIPISNGSHKYVLCINLKYPEVNVFDNSRMRNKNGTAKVVYSVNASDLRVAEILRTNCAEYLQYVKHVNAGAIYKAEVRRREFEWETDNRPNDCGIFAMRHMEHYMGGEMIYWNCGIVEEGKKQTSQLSKLRRKYAARLLLAECNAQKDKIKKELADMQAPSVNMKARKVPRPRK